MPTRWEDLGLDLPFLFDLTLRTIYTRGQITGGELANELAIPFAVLNPVFQAMRKQIADRHRRPARQQRRRRLRLRDQAAQGDRGARRTRSTRPPTSARPRSRSPTTSRSVLAQTIKKLVVTRRSIRKAFEDLIITDDVVQRDRPGDQLGASIFFFGYPGNGKTSIAERITRLMGDTIYIPYAVEANGQIIKVFDPIQHTVMAEDDKHDGDRNAS